MISCWRPGVWHRPCCPLSDPSLESAAWAAHMVRLRLTVRQKAGRRLEEMSVHIAPAARLQACSLMRACYLKSSCLYQVPKRGVVRGCCGYMPSCVLGSPRQKCRQRRSWQFGGRCARRAAGRAPLLAPDCGCG